MSVSKGKVLEGVVVSDKMDKPLSFKVVKKILTPAL